MVEAEKEREGGQGFEFGAGGGAAELADFDFGARETAYEGVGEIHINICVVAKREQGSHHAELVRAAEAAGLVALRNERGNGVEFGTRSRYDDQVVVCENRRIAKRHVGNFPGEAHDDRDVRVVAEEHVRRDHGAFGDGAAFEEGAHLSKRNSEARGVAFEQVVVDKTGAEQGCEMRGVFRREPT